MTITVTDKNKITISTGSRGPQGIQGLPGSGSALVIQDEGTTLATDATTLNFVGAGISAVGTGTTKTITVTGLGGGGSFSGDYNDLVNSPTFATIATTGNYTDLSNLPSLFDGNYNSLTNKPTLFSGSYNDLSNKPTLFSESYTDLTNKPTLATVAGTGNYNDLTNKPTIPTAFSGVYSDLTSKPTLSAVATSGSYTDLTNTPTAGSTLTIADEGTNLTTDATLLDFVGAGVTVSGTGTTKTVTITGGGAGSFSGSYTDLSNKPNVESLTVGGDLDLGTNKVLFSNMYAALVDLPSATSYHGMFAHVHATGKAYYAHGGNWIEMANASDITTTLPYSSITGTPTLGTVATSNDYTDLTNKPTLFSESYTDLTNKPTLGTAAATDTTAYATSAQGNTADTAVQPAAITNMVKTTDSIDVLSDVDTTTAAPTNGQTLVYNTASSKFIPGTITGGGGTMSGSAIKTAYEAEANTNAFNDSAVIKLAGIEAQADVTDTTNVVAALTGGTDITIAADGTINYVNAGATAATPIGQQNLALWNDTAQHANSWGNAAPAVASGVNDPDGYEYYTVTDNSNTSFEMLATVISTSDIAYSSTAEYTFSVLKAGFTKPILFQMAYNSAGAYNVQTVMEMKSTGALVITDSNATLTGTPIVNDNGTSWNVKFTFTRPASGTMTWGIIPAFRTTDSTNSFSTSAMADVDVTALRIAGTSGSALALTVQDEGTDLTATTGKLNFVGAGVTASGTGATKTITISGSSQTNAEIKTAYEANADTNALTDSEKTLIGTIETNADVTDTTNVVAALSAGNNITISAGGEIASTGGGGSAITLQDEGSALTTDATTLNFVGAGVVATGTGAVKTITVAGGTSASQVTNPEIIAGTSTVIKSYAPNDIELFVAKHAPNFSAVDTTTTTNTGSDTLIGEQDLTASGWDLHTGDESFIGNNLWSLATRASTSTTDSDGYNMYTVTDSGSSGGGQVAWETCGIQLTDAELSTSSTITLTMEVLKSSLTKPFSIMCADTDTGFQFQGWFELTTTGGFTSQGSGSQMLNPVVTDLTNTYRLQFDVVRATADMFIQYMPTLRGSDGGAYSKYATGSITVSPLRVKATAGAGGSTTTTTVTVTKLQEKHVLPTQTKMVDGATLGTVSTKDVAFCIVMGQSNCAGVAGNSPSTASISNVYTMTAGNYNFSSYVNNDSNVYKTSGSGSSNPLTEITREWQARKDANSASTPDLYIINISKGGTGFVIQQAQSSQWDPYTRRNGVDGYYNMPVAGTVNDNASLFFTAQKAIREALYQFAKNGQRAFHIGTVWNQWENDAINADAVDRYAANLTLIRAMVDEELGIKDADFYPWMPIANYNQYATHKVQFQRIFNNFAENENNVKLINCEDMAHYTGTSPGFGVFNNDNLHHSSTTQIAAAKFVLDQGYFKLDSNGNPTRRARRVIMKVANLAGVTMQKPNGDTVNVTVDDAGANVVTDLNSVN